MTETMDVRIDGQIVKRSISYTEHLHFFNGDQVPIQQHPETQNDETAVFTMGDLIPTIIKTLPL